MLKPIKSNPLPLVSIVVPIFQVEAYLRKCVQSILMQSYTNIEIILVDDGSRDNCPEICDKFANEDNRVKVIHKINGGLSDARNSGLSIANGEYIAFIDSDDYIDKYFISNLLDACIKNGADISTCSFYRLKENELIKKMQTKPSALLFTNLDAVRDIMLPNSKCEVMTWNKLYKTSLFHKNKIIFPVGKIHEDNFTTYKLLYFANKVVFIDKPLYYYIQRDGSIVSSQFTDKRFDVYEAFELTKKFFEDKSVNLEAELEVYHLLITLGLVSDYVLKGGEKFIQEKLKIELRKSRIMNTYKYLDKKTKLKYLIVTISFSLYRVVIKNERMIKAKI